MIEIDIHDDVVTQANKVLDIFENTAEKAGVPTRCYYLGKAQRERIIAALENVLPKTYEKIPVIGKLYTPSCLAIAACSHYVTPDALIHKSSGLAAAMWMCDHVDQTAFPASKLLETFSGEQFSALPSEILKVCNIDKDPELLRSYAQILANRLSPLHYQYYDQNDAEQRYGSTHDIYTRLKAAIPHEKIQEAEDMFMDRLWAYLEIELKVVKLLLLKYSGEKAVQCETATSILNMPKKSTKPPAFNIKAGKNGDPMFILNSAMFAVIGLPLLIDGSTSIAKGLDLETQEKIKKIVAEFDPLHTRDGKDVDPFTIAFGYQHLIDQDDDLAYLPGISCAMVSLYMEMLPWTREEHEQIDNKAELPSWCRKSNSIYAPKIWTSAGSKKNTGIYLTPVQILYDYEKTSLSPSYEMDTTKAITPKGSDMGECHEQPNVPVQKVPEEGPNDDESAETDKKLNMLKSEIDQLRKELTATKKNLKKSEHERMSVEKKANEIKAENGSYLRELRKLREHINIQTPISCGETEQKDSEYQYSVPVGKKIVVYGGQDSWRNALKAIIPGITFAKTSKEVNAELIHHADIVWVQTHAISHATYTTVRDCARRSGVPVRLFASKGISSCAAQLAACAVG